MRSIPQEDTTAVFPPEILSSVFSHCRPENIRDPPNVTQVCSRWRIIAHATPNLWTALTLELPPALKSEADAHNFESTIADWVSRSADLCVDLSVMGAYYKRSSLRDTDFTSLQRSLYGQVYRDIVMKFSNKWRYIDLYDWEAHDFFAKVSHLHALHDLIIPIDNPHSRTSATHIPIESLPPLTKLEAQLGRSPQASCLRNFIPNTIKDLTLISSPGMLGLHDGFVFEILQIPQLQNLTCLSLNSLGWYEPSAIIPTFSFPALLELDLGGAIVGMGELLIHSSLPSLQNLSLETSYFSSNGSYGPKVGPALVQLQKKSRFPLSKLSLTWMLDEGDNQAIHFDDFLQFLTAVSPSLRELHIRAHDSGTDYSRLIKFISYDAEKRVLPCLVVFSTLDVRDRDGLFGDFVRSRWWANELDQKEAGVARLERVSLISCKLTKTSQAILESCEEEGLYCVY